MELIQKPLAEQDANLPVVELTVSRFKLQKRRWRAEAADGTDFGFDLEQPLTHGAMFFQTATARYIIAQERSEERRVWKACRSRSSPAH